jgi:hypothetical protein
LSLASNLKFPRFQRASRQSINDAFTLSSVHPLPLDKPLPLRGSATLACREKGQMERCKDERSKVKQKFQNSDKSVEKFVFHRYFPLKTTETQCETVASTGRIVSCNSALGLGLIWKNIPVACNLLRFQSSLG